MGLLFAFAFFGAIFLAIANPAEAVMIFGTCAAIAGAALIIRETVLAVYESAVKCAGWIRKLAGWTTRC